MSITEVEDLTMFCRVCLQMPDEPELLDLNLVYDEDEQLTYHDCFTMCTQINLAEGEGLPQNLCRSCGLELQMAYDFYKKVEDSKRFLIQLQDQQAEAAVAGAEEIVTASTQEVDQEEVEEHLELDEYQAVEHLDEEVIEYIVVEETSRQVPQQQTHVFSIKTVADEPNVTAEGKIKNVDAILVAATMKQKPQLKDVAYSLRPTSTVSTTPANKLPIKLPRIVTSNSDTVCDFCGKMFANKSRMLWHRHIHDTNRPKYPCPDTDCKRVYATKQARDVHFKQTHLVEGLVCPVCNKIFIVRQSLEVHMRYHTGEFPYACKICGKRYGQKGHLTTHMQVKHNNLRYFCSVPGCLKMFRNSMSLRNHRFVHSEMPFKCAYCEKGYPQKSKLKAHISSKHFLNVSLEDLESMRKFQDTRTRHSFMKIIVEDPNDNDESAMIKEGIAAVREIIVKEEN